MAGALAPVAAALGMVACGGDDERDADLPPASPLVGSGCSPIAYGGEGRPDRLIAASTVLQGQFIDHGVQI